MYNRENHNGYHHNYGGRESNHWNPEWGPSNENWDSHPNENYYHHGQNWHPNEYYSEYFFFFILQSDH